MIGVKRLLAAAFAAEAQPTERYAGIAFIGAGR